MGEFYALTQQEAEELNKEGGEEPLTQEHYLHGQGKGSHYATFRVRSQVPSRTTGKYTYTYFDAQQLWDWVKRHSSPTNPLTKEPIWREDWWALHDRYEPGSGYGPAWVKNLPQIDPETPDTRTYAPPSPVFSDDLTELWRLRESVEDSAGVSEVIAHLTRMQGAYTDSTEYLNDMLTSADHVERLVHGIWGLFRGFDYDPDWRQSREVISLKSAIVNFFSLICGIRPVMLQLRYIEDIETDVRAFRDHLLTSECVAMFVDMGIYRTIFTYTNRLYHFLVWSTDIPLEWLAVDIHDADRTYRRTPAEEQRYRALETEYKAIFIDEGRLNSLNSADMYDFFRKEWFSDAVFRRLKGFASMLRGVAHDGDDGGRRIITAAMFGSILNLAGKYRMMRQRPDEVPALTNIPQAEMPRVLNTFHRLLMECYKALLLAVSTTPSRFSGPLESLKMEGFFWCYVAPRFRDRPDFHREAIESMMNDELWTTWYNLMHDPAVAQELTVAGPPPPAPRYNLRSTPARDNARWR